MTTTDISSHVPYRQVTDGNGRTYRIGESDRDIMGRPRWTMVLFPWIGMLGISSSEYAFT
ncbi:MFS transporter, partial [Streptomyces sp. NPDC002596]